MDSILEKEEVDFLVEIYFSNIFIDIQEMFNGNLSVVSKSKECLQKLKLLCIDVAYEYMEKGYIASRNINEYTKEYMKGYLLKEKYIHPTIRKLFFKNYKYSLDEQKVEYFSDVKMENDVKYFVDEFILLIFNYGFVLKCDKKTRPFST